MALTARPLVLRASIKILSTKPKDEEVEVGVHSDTWRCTDGGEDGGGGGQQKSGEGQRVHCGCVGGH